MSNVHAGLQVEALAWLCFWVRGSVARLHILTRSRPSTPWARDGRNVHYLSVWRGEQSTIPGVGERRRIRKLVQRVRKQLTEGCTAQDLDAVERMLDDSEDRGRPFHILLQLEKERNQRLLQVIRALNAESDLDRLLQQIVDAAIDLVGAERGFLLLGRQAPYTMAAARRFGAEDIDEQYLHFSRTVAGKVAGEDRVMRIEDAMADPELSKQASVVQQRLRSILAVPLHGKDQVIGSLYLDNRFARNQFGVGDVELIQGLADQAAIAIASARMKEELARRNREVEQLNVVLEGRLEAAASRLASQSARLAAQVGGFHGLIGESPRMLRIFGEIEKIALAGIPVVVEGESGTGKELVARAIHACSDRCDGPFISENFSAISTSLAESELFGHVRGAFTGASQARKGLFELAQGGTLFLDEVAGMSELMQTKLLRVLERGEVRPVGGHQMVQVDVRFISASNSPLEELVESKHLREDLYYRLRGYCLQLPPLRERADDIPLLLTHFLEGRPICHKAVNALSSHHWRGNVRELKNTCRSLLAMTRGRIELAHLPPCIGSNES